MAAPTLAPETINNKLDSKHIPLVGTLQSNAMSKKIVSQPKETFWSKQLFDPISDWLTDRARSRNQANRRTTRQHLDNISPESCMILLDRVLRQTPDETKEVDRIFKSNATTYRSGKYAWGSVIFARFLQTGPTGNAAVTNFILILWRALCTAAFCPFSLQSGDPNIDLNAFRRAFVLLVTRGDELLGAMSDGSTAEWSRNLSRICGTYTSSLS